MRLEKFQAYLNFRWVHMSEGTFTDVATQNDYQRIYIINPVEMQFSKSCNIVATKISNKTIHCVILLRFMLYLLCTVHD